MKTFTKTFLSMCAVVTLLPYYADAQASGDTLWAKWAVSGEITSISLLPAGKGIVSSDLEGNSALWQLDGSRPNWSHSSPLELPGTIYCSAPIGETGTVLCGCAVGSICVWNPATGLYGTQIADAAAGVAVRFIACSPDGSLAATGSDDGHFRLISLSTGKIVFDMSGSGEGEGPVCISSNGMLALGVVNGVVQIVDITTLTETQTFSNLHTSYTGAAASNPAVPGQFAISGLNGIYVIDASGRILSTWGNFSNASSLDFSPDGKLLAVSLNGSGGISILNLGDSTSFTLPGSSSFCRFINQDTLVSTVGSDISFFSIRKRAFIGTLTALAGGGDMAFSSDGRRLATSGGGDGIAIWDAQTGALDGALVSYPNDGNTAGGMAASSDLTKFVGVGASGELYFWQNISAPSIQLRGIISDTTPSVVLAYSPTDSIFASGTAIYEPDTLYRDNRNTVQLWSVQDGSLIRQLNGPFFPVTAIAFSRDGSKIAATFQGTSIICVWDTKDGTLLDSNSQGDTLISFVNTILPGTNKAVEIKLNWDPDSIVNVIDLGSGATEQTFTVNGEILNSIAVNPVTGDFATGTQDGSVIVWKSPLSSGVKLVPTQTPQPLDAFASNRHIKINLPIGAESGRVFVYRTDGRCFFSAEVGAGESSVTTPELPSGVYFIVYEPSIGQRSFTKVSLFQ